MINPTRVFFFFLWRSWPLGSLLKIEISKTILHFHAPICVIIAEYLSEFIVKLKYRTYGIICKCMQKFMLNILQSLVWGKVWCRQVCTFLKIKMDSLQHVGFLFFIAAEKPIISGSSSKCWSLYGWTVFIRERITANLPLPLSLVYTFAVYIQDDHLVPIRLGSFFCVCVHFIPILQWNENTPSFNSKIKRKLA